MTRLPEDVRQFLHQNIESVERLEVLLLLWGTPQRGWTSDEVAAAFWVLGVQRLALAFSRNMVEDDTGLYLVRLFAFLLILGAIVDKNRSSPQPPG